MPLRDTHKIMKHTLVKIALLLGSVLCFAAPFVLTHATEHDPCDEPPVFVEYYVGTEPTLLPSTCGKTIVANRLLTEIFLESERMTDTDTMFSVCGDPFNCSIGLFMQTESDQVYGASRVGVTVDIGLFL